MRDVEALPEEDFARALRRARHKFELMRRLGTDTVLVCSSVSPHALDDDALAAEQLGRLAGLAQDHGIRVAYEALAWGRHVSTYDHAWRVVEAADHPALGICLDSFHILSRGSDPKGIGDIPGEKIFFLQLADAPLLAMDVLQWSRHYRCFPGQGGFDLAGLLRHVLRAGYAGPLSLEVFNDVFRQSDAGPTAVDARRSLLVLQEQVGTAVLPALTSPTGVAFAELVTPDAAPVSAVLGALGFARTARHRGKPVDLWQRGDARILVNTGPAERREGTRLAAVGLESPDPAAAALRAETLLAPVLPRRRTPEDAPLEAVAAPDGTELFFCATGHPRLPDWRTDFEDVEDAGSAPGDDAGWRVDHLSLTQPWHQFDEAALFNRAVLGLRPQESVDVADPYGLLRSRAVTTDDGAVRVVLTVGAAPVDDTAHAQHIALATDDVVAAARAHRAAGASCCRSPTTTTTTSRPASSSPTASWTRTGSWASSTTATTTAPSGTATRAPSAGSSSNSSSATAPTAATAPRTPRSAWQRNTRHADSPAADGAVHRAVSAGTVAPAARRAGQASWRWAPSSVRVPSCCS
ncbi:hypothetical protein STENM223S_03639 [Streptomyces tendae]